MDRTDDIRTKFEEALAEGLKGEPVLITDQETGEKTPLIHDGAPVLAPPQASFLAVVRAYLKDRQEVAPKKPDMPSTGEARGALKEFLAGGKGANLPFPPIKQ